MTYSNIRKQIEDYAAARIDKFRRDITGKTAGEILKNYYFRDYTTPGTFEALKQLPAGDVPGEILINRIIAKCSREQDKNARERREKLEAAEAVAAPEFVRVSVDWVKNRTWGNNPHAVVSAEKTRTFGKASGCGYDKESAAIAQAMNANSEIMRILYDHAEKGGNFPYSVLTFAGLPFFDGGCGVSCFRSVFESCGYKWENVASGKTYDVYTITRTQQPEAAAGFLAFDSAYGKQETR